MQDVFLQKLRHWSLDIGVYRVPRHCAMSSVTG